MAGGRGTGRRVAAAQCLADDVQVISPLTAQFRFHGPVEVGYLLAAAFEVIHDIRYHTSVGDGDTRGLFYRARAGGEQVEEAQLPPGRQSEWVTDMDWRQVAGIRR